MIATMDQAWAPDTIELIPEPGRSHLIKRLETLRQYLTTFHELAVAAILQSAGLSPEYEVRIDGATPDWMVRDRAPMLVEVWTRRQPESVRRSDLGWEVLRARLQAIPVPVWLHIVGLPDPSGSPPSSSQVRSIGSEVKHWLLSTISTPAYGDLRESAGYVFRIGGPAPGTRTLIHTPTAGAVVTTDMILKQIRSKVRKYRYLATKLSQPLVVVLAGETNSAMTLNMLVPALRGVTSVSMTLDPLGAPGVTTTTKFGKWTTNIPEVFNSALSGVGWIEVGPEAPGKLTMIPVASAALSLPDIASPLIEIDHSLTDPRS